MELYDATKLEQEHKRLEASIEIEYARPAPDDGLLGALKRQKLKIKDQIVAGTAARIRTSHQKVRTLGSGL